MKEKKQIVKELRGIKCLKSLSGLDVLVYDGKFEHKIYFAGYRNGEDSVDTIVTATYKQIRKHPNLHQQLSPYMTGEEIVQLLTLSSKR